MYPGGLNYHRLFVISGYLIVEYFGFSTSDRVTIPEHRHGTFSLSLKTTSLIILYRTGFQELEVERTI